MSYTVVNGVTSTGLSVDNSDVLTVEYGAIVSTTVATFGQVYVDADGIAISSLILDGGQQNIYPGGSATYTIGAGSWRWTAKVMAAL